MSAAWLMIVVFAVGHEGVTASLVCQIRQEMKRKPEWTSAECKQIAKALVETRRPRTALAIMILESCMWERAEAIVSPILRDVGLMQVRCRLDDAGRCENGAVAGYSPEDLRDPITNLRVAKSIMDEKQRIHGASWRSHYGGCRKPSCLYARKVRAMETALSGRMPRLHKIDRRQSLYRLVFEVAKATKSRKSGERQDKILSFSTPRK